MTAGGDFTLRHPEWSGVCRGIERGARHCATMSGSWTLREYPALRRVVAPLPECTRGNDVSDDTVRSIAFSGREKAMLRARLGEFDQIQDTVRCYTTNALRVRLVHTHSLSMTHGKSTQFPMR